MQTLRELAGYTGLPQLGKAIDDFASHASGRPQQRARDKIIGETKAAALDDIDEGYANTEGLYESDRHLGARGDYALDDGLDKGSFDTPDKAVQADFVQGNSPDAYKEEAFNFMADPGYLFRLKQSQDAIRAKSAAEGGLFSGGTLSELSANAGKMASDEYKSAYDRYDTDRKFGLDKNKEAFNQYDTNTNRAFDIYKNKGGLNQKDWENKRTKIQDKLSLLTGLHGMGQNYADKTSNRISQYATNKAALLNSATSQQNQLTGATNDVIKTLGQVGAAFL
jgi:hypothetical protein